MFLEEAFAEGGAFRTAHQRDWPADDVRRHPAPDAHVIVRQVALGDAGVVPVDALRMRQLHRADRVVAFRRRGARPMGDGCATLDRRGGAAGDRFCLAHDFGCLLVFAQSLVRSLPHAVAMRPAPEVNLDDRFRFDPHRAAAAALFLRHRRKRRRLHGHRIELAVEIACGFMREAGAGTPGIAQRALVIDAEHQCADAVGVGGGRDKAGDHEFLPVRALGLDPIVAAARVIGAHRLFRDDAFEAERAGALDERRPIFIDGFAQAHGAARRRPRQQIGQRRLARSQRQRPQVGAAEMHQVEGVIDHACAVAGGQRLLQQREARNAVVTFDHDLAVDQGGLDL